MLIFNQLKLPYKSISYNFIKNTSLYNNILNKNSLNLIFIHKFSTLENNDLQNNTEILNIKEDEIETEPMRQVRTKLLDMPGKWFNHNIVARLIYDLPVEKALIQLEFSKKKSAALFKKLLNNAINLADINYDIPPTHLKVKKVWVTRGRIIRKIRFMGKGRSGRARSQVSHLNIILEEINWKDKILGTGREEEKFLKKKGKGTAWIRRRKKWIQLAEKANVDVESIQNSYFKKQNITIDQKNNDDQNSLEDNNNIKQEI